MTGRTAVQLHLGDSRDVLPTLNADSVDAVVTDPPAGIGFMGKAWDREAVMTDILPLVLRESLRVTKPGGLLVCWALPRTSHWTGLAIEAAGWEIRDIVTHHYGQGFPKSHNISKTLKDKCLCCTCRSDAIQYTPSEEMHHAATKARSGLRPVREGVPPQVAANAEQGSVLQSSVLWGVAGDESRDPRAHGVDSLEGQGGLDGSEPGILPGEDVWAGQSGVEGRGDIQEDQGELHRAEVRKVSGGSDLDGENGRVRNGASVGFGQDGGKAARPRRNRASSRPHDTEQRCEQSGTLAEQRDAQGDGAWPLCDRCRKPIVPDGLGTALKPATEFWFLAQKPFRGTFAENVLVHGTGGLGVDECRVPTGEKLGRLNHTASTFNTRNSTPWVDNSGGLGRWPANLVLSHGPDCNGECGGGCPVRLMGEQSGSARFFSCFDHDPFIYAAKASQKDRNEGCEGMDKKVGPAQFNDGMIGAVRSDGTIVKEAIRQENSHPTVKSVHLMRWLCRLACPEGGTILDPFMGSGSTGKAASLEGFGFVGIERDPEYYAIAERRIAAARSGAPLFEAASGA